MCSEQQILELVLDGVKGIVAFEELPQLLRRLRLVKPDHRFVGAAINLRVQVKIISAESWSNAAAFTIIASQPMAITSVGGISYV